MAVEVREAAAPKGELREYSYEGSTFKFRDSDVPPGARPLAPVDAPPAPEAKAKEARPPANKSRKPANKATRGRTPNATPPAADRS